MENYSQKFDKKVKFEAAQKSNEIATSVIASVAADIQKERAELAIKAMSKQRALTGQLYAFKKPDIKGTWTTNSEGVKVKSPDSWSDEAVDKEAKLKENLDKLDLAIIACLDSPAFVLNTSEGAPSEENQIKEFTSRDISNWETLKRYTLKEDKDTFTKW